MVAKKNAIASGTSPPPAAATVIAAAPQATEAKVITATLTSLRSLSWSRVRTASGPLVRIVSEAITPASAMSPLSAISRTAAIETSVAGSETTDLRATVAPIHSASRSGSAAALCTPTCSIPRLAR